MSGAKTVEVKISRVRGALFEAKNEDGLTCMIDGAPELGGQGVGVRPMQMVLMGLAGCSALDVIHILEKQQKEPLEDLVVTVKGTRADAIPSVYTAIEVHFEASGAVDRHKLERAVKLSMEKYCSVAKMLEKSATITHTTTLRG
jgi:putative redox protein